MSEFEKMTTKQLAAQAMLYWSNHIETGCVHMTAADVKRQEKPGSLRHEGEMKALTTKQMKLVIRLRESARRLAR